MSTSVVETTLALRFLLSFKLIRFFLFVINLKSFCYPATPSPMDSNYGSGYHPSPGMPDPSPSSYGLSPSPSGFQVTSNNYSDFCKDQTFYFVCFDMILCKIQSKGLSYRS